MNGMIVFFTLLATLLYALVTWQVSQRVQRQQSISVMAQATMGMAVWLHLAVIGAIILFTPGNPLSLGLIAGAIIGLMTFLLVITAFFRNLRALYIFAAPVSALALLIAIFLPTPAANQLPSNPLLLTHILLAITSYAFISIATLMALIVIVQIRQLKHHRMSRTIWLLPPLQATERLHVELLMIGFALLTIAMAIGVTIATQYSELAILMPKGLTTLIGWVILAVLLFGHLIAGWRGETAARLTIIGAITLCIGYFASRFVVGSLAFGA